jgi:hypothetical protein
MTKLRMEPKVVSCLLIHYKGGEDVVVGEFTNYEEAYKAARNMGGDRKYRIFKTVETFVRVREMSFRHTKKEFDQQLLIERDTAAKDRSLALSQLSDQELQDKIKNNGDIF